MSRQDWINLMKRLRNGDPAAWPEFVEAMRPFIVAAPNRFHRAGGIGKIEKKDVDDFLSYFTDDYMKQSGRSFADHVQDELAGRAYLTPEVLLGHLMDNIFLFERRQRKLAELAEVNSQDTERQETLTAEANNILILMVFQYRKEVESWLRRKFPKLRHTAAPSQNLLKTHIKSDDRQADDAKLVPLDGAAQVFQTVLVNIFRWGQPQSPLGVAAFVFDIAGKEAIRLLKIPLSLDHDALRQKLEAQLKVLEEQLLKSPDPALKEKQRDLIQQLKELTQSRFVPLDPTIKNQFDILKQQEIRRSLLDGFRALSDFCRRALLWFFRPYVFDDAELHAEIDGMRLNDEEDEAAAIQRIFGLTVPAFKGRRRNCQQAMQDLVGDWEMK